MYYNSLYELNYLNLLKKKQNTLFQQNRIINKIEDSYKVQLQKTVIVFALVLGSRNKSLSKLPKNICLWKEISHQMNFNRFIQFETKYFLH